MRNSMRKKLAYLLTLSLAILSGCNENTNRSEDKGKASGAEQPNIWPRAQKIRGLTPDQESRIEEILARMTLAEKVGQVIQADSDSVSPEDVRRYNLGSVLSGGNSAPGSLPYATAEAWIEAADAYYEASVDTTDGGVGIPIIWGIDAVHGHNNVIGGTIFPHNIALGAVNDPALVAEIAAITAQELRVTGHDWTFAPTLAVPQDDRWGRTYEGFSELPAITQKYASAIVLGLQGDPDSNTFMQGEKIIASAKHFVADGGTIGGQDQGNSEASERELYDTHGAAYIEAIEAGAQVIMASFSSWHGRKIHGDKYLLTDVLKAQIGFEGFVVGDWNAHGQVDGCSNENCPTAINAGLDMYMAPDSWKGLYENLLSQTSDGTISPARLDDAVRRILRVKMRAGLFDLVKPSARPLAGDSTILGSPRHRSVAREAVRRSLVLLKNNDNVLPVKPGLKVLVIGSSANSISDASGGWTLTWQGGGLPNSAFPNGQSILSGLQDAITDAGGSIEYSEDGSYSQKPDIVIAVYGEKPYAEFQGDVPTLLYANPDILEKLRELKAAEVKTVSLFLSGRPMWVNPLLNASDAFVAVWWPGTEGGGISDVLVANPDGTTKHDFEGTLSFSWPKHADQSQLNPGDHNYDPLFKYGFGLKYATRSTLGVLSEDVGSATTGLNKYIYFTQGRPQAPWRIKAQNSQASGTDFDAQEDALSIIFDATTGGSVSIYGEVPIDLFREMNGAMELAFTYRLDEQNSEPILLTLGCTSEPSCQGQIDISKAISQSTKGEWSDMRVSLSCFAAVGADVNAVDLPFELRGSRNAALSIANVRLIEDADGKESCPR
ncbi:glycoside hydrolase family 3 protein [Gimibacter soli]|uniref:Glycoside hydrolase family 3 N-terminal domain-containing protein n=1 Tax=Gimibacter soli TaxID=3024400 RepID=A0AAE9XM83_9PROT|nr:glycoside hydrolase family 3 protein [Gimibacter soli]WCL53483.1 glycoside hydrolase family 3 N-terminal domain-containing protein [Gimibacter soli]